MKHLVPIFIVGAARSGTTWVYDILNVHPQVHGIFESWVFSKKWGVGALFPSSHWGEKKSGLARVLKREELVQSVRQLVDSILMHNVDPEKMFLVEKSPSHIFDIELISEIYPDARFIHVVRDGRDVSVSVRAATRNWVPHWRDSFGKSVYHSAKSWRDTIARGQAMQKKLGDRFLELRYEQLRREPVVAYRRLFDFCDIPCDDDFLAKAIEKTDFDRNFKANENNFRRGGRIGDWRSQFSYMDALSFNRAAGGMLIRCGYAKSRWWWPRLFRVGR